MFLSNDTLYGHSFDETVLGGTINTIQCASIKLLSTLGPLHHLPNQWGTQVDTFPLRTTLLRRCFVSQGCLTRATNEMCQHAQSGCLEYANNTVDSQLLFASCFTHTQWQLVKPRKKAGGEKHS